MPCSGVDVHQAAVRLPRQSACGLRESEAPVGVELSSTAALEGPVGKVVGAGAGVARSAGLEMPRVCGSVARWLAAKAGGFHYRYDASQGAWLDTKGAGEFFANLSRYATEQSGLVLQFSAR